MICCSFFNTNNIVAIFFLSKRTDEQFTQNTGIIIETKINPQTSFIQHGGNECVYAPLSTISAWSSDSKVFTQ